MIQDPERRGREAARLYAELTPKLFEDLAEAGVLPAADHDRARREWECFALYACVRGLVAAGGFNRETAGAIDALHEAVLARWTAGDHANEDADERRRLISERYGEYGAIGQAGGRSGAATVTRRLGEAAARRMTGSETPTAELCELVGALHEALVETALETLQREA